MSRTYKLIASRKEYYHFHDEQVLELGEPITKLSDMDYLTCRYPNQEYLLSLLTNDGEISGKNHLSIQYLKNKRVYYLNPLFDQPQMLDIIPQLKEEKNQMAYQKILTIPRNHPFFQEKLAEFYAYINTSPEYFFETIYQKYIPKNLEHLVMLYHENKGKTFDALEDEYNYHTIKRNLELEFSRYQTFRQYLIVTNQILKTRPLTILKTNSLELDTLEAEDYDYEEFLTEEEIMRSVAEGDDVYVMQKRLNK